MLRQRFTYGVHVIAELLNSFTAIISTLLLHMFPFPYVAGEVHVMGSCKVDLNCLPTTGYLGGSLNSFTATASTFLLNPFMSSYVEFLQCYRFYITDSPFNRLPTTGYLGGSEFLHGYHFYISA